MNTIKLGKKFDYMDKNKILEAARKNKSKGCEYENKESIRSSLLGAIIALFVGIALFMFELFAKKSVNFSLITVAMTAICVQYLYEGIKNKKMQLIAFGGFCTLTVIVSFFIFIAQVVS